MPTYMDRHDGVTVTPEELAGAHAMDVAAQEKHGVNYLSYWYDRDSECVFCFVDAPSKAAAEAVHREAHGLVANKIIEVEGQAVMRFLGPPPAHPVGEAHAESAFRTILFTDIVGSTDMNQRLGDAKAMELLRAHDRIVRTELVQVGGTEVKHTGDGIMASFSSVARADRLRDRDPTSARDAQRSCRSAGAGPYRRKRGRTRRRARRPVRRRRPARSPRVQPCRGGAILTSTAVRELCVGKGFEFEARGPFELKGFGELVPLYEVIWRQ